MSDIRWACQADHREVPAHPRKEIRLRLCTSPHPAESLFLKSQTLTPSSQERYPLEFPTVSSFRRNVLLGNFRVDAQFGAVPVEFLSHARCDVPQEQGF